MNVAAQQLTLFMFPFAGGNKYSFSPYAGKLPAGIKMIAIEPPGRGARTNEPLITDLNQMALDFFEQIRHKLLQPYIILGHSMGSWLAYLVTQLIVAEGLPLPEHLFFTGSGNPAVYKPKVIRHQMNRKDFFEHLYKLGGISEALYQNETLLEYFEPILRADFEAVETFVYQQRAPLDIPVTVIIGSEEMNITPAMAQAWQQETVADFEVLTFEGNHFFINEKVEDIIAVIEDKVGLDKSA